MNIMTFFRIRCPKLIFIPLGIQSAAEFRKIALPPLRMQNLKHNHKLGQQKLFSNSEYMSLMTVGNPQQTDAVKVTICTCTPEAILISCV